MTNHCGNKPITPKVVVKVFSAFIVIYLAVNYSPAEGKRDIGDAKLEKDSNEAVNQVNNHVDELKDEANDAAENEAEHQADDDAGEEHEDSSEPREAHDNFNEPKDYSLVDQTTQTGDEADDAAEDEAEDEADDEAEEEHEDSSETGEGQDAFNELKEYSLVNQTTETGDLEITVATWNILAVIKSGQTASAMIRFNLATENPEATPAPPDVVKFHNAKKKFLLSLGYWNPYMNINSDIDLLGLQEVDAIQEDWVEELGAKFGMGVTKGPVYDSGFGSTPMKDASYLLWKKSKFSDADCKITTPIKEQNQQYMKCTMAVTSGGKLKIVTGHSASDGIAATTKVKREDGTKETVVLQDTQEIAAFKPAVLFGDWNTNIDQVKKALTTTSPQTLTITHSHPATSSDVNDPTMRKSAYKYRKLTQGAKKVTQGWPIGEHPKTCHYLLNHEDQFATDTKDGQPVYPETRANIEKYAKNRWCKKGKEEYEELVTLLGKETVEAGTFQLDTVYEKIKCTASDCKKLEKEAQADEYVKLTIGQEDGIFTAGRATIVEGTQQTVGMGPIPEGDLGYPNSAWLSDHFLLKAKVHIPEALLGRGKPRRAKVDRAKVIKHQKYMKQLVNKIITLQGQIADASANAKPMWQNHLDTELKNYEKATRKKWTNKGDALRYLTRLQQLLD